MSTQPFERAVAAARSVIATVSPDQHDLPTPCLSWDVAALIDHLVDAPRFFAAGMHGQPPGEGRGAGDDPVGAFDQASADLLAAFQEDGALEMMVPLPFGSLPGAGVMGLATNDLFTHAWDLAKATGQSTDLDPGLAEDLLEQSKQNMQDGFRGADGEAPFGFEQDCGDDATAADRLAAFLGRAV